ncbi:MAG: Asp-tRNA(Asn)/Glu-tRNA(Gln) amidotransferase subunit GatA [Rickettsia sp.]|nr:Asp-tRNA(Asn)/Glu-tRNA(Gln) amidotransferase subunit GatA [Rickettsia sp.]
MEENLVKITIKDAIRKLQNKEISVVDLVQAHISQILKNKKLNAYITYDFDLAIEQAKISQSRYDNNTSRMLEGIPIAVKDVFCTKGIRTTAASRMLSNFIPFYESGVTEKLNNHGYIMIGKSNMDEFAMGSTGAYSYFGASINPWKISGDNSELTPGGSSSGSAVAVSSFQSMASIGSDTGGSIRQPASFTGLFGIKPTYSRCSRWGMIAFANSLDQAGVFARNLPDLALVLTCIMGHDKKDYTSSLKPIPNLFDIESSPKDISLAIGRDLLSFVKMNPDLLKMFSDLLDVLIRTGFEVKDVKLHNIEFALSAYYIIASAEASSNLARYDSIKYGVDDFSIEEKSNWDINDLYFNVRTKNFGEEVKRRIMLGSYVLSRSHMEKYYKNAQKIRYCFKKDFKEIFADSDVIILPTTTQTAYPFAKDTENPTDAYYNDIFTIPASLVGLPCMSIPIGKAPNGLPVGIQLIANHFQEDKLFKLAKIITSILNLNLIPKDF